jgi:predicted transcriptional regulator
MATITFELADDLNAELDELCAKQGVDKLGLIAELVEQRVSRERFRKKMEDPAFIAEIKRMQDEGLLDVDPNEYADMLPKDNS